jgi:imidazole glycerol-phosphate synthase subunit HisH
MRVDVVDIGIGNVLSVANWIKRCDVDATLIRDRAWKPNEKSIIVLPGVGNSVSYVRALREHSGLCEEIANSNYSKLIGICAGFQVLTNSVSEDGKTEQGLGKINAQSRPISTNSFHNGWEQLSSNHFEVDEKRLNIRKKVYFNHGCGVYMDSLFDGHNDTNKLGFSNFVIRKNIFGLQFHPEKSGVFGEIIGRQILNV